MRISDWSSDVCSSDLPAVRRRRATLRFRRSPEARAHHPHRWSAGVMSENEPQTDQTPADDTQALTGEPASAAPMRLRAEPPRVTRLSRKVLAGRSEEHTSELQSLMRISYAVFCLKKKN